MRMIVRVGVKSTHGGGRNREGGADPYREDRLG